MKARSDFNQIKRISKMVYYQKAKVNLCNLAKAAVSPRKFWERIRLSNSSTPTNSKLSADDFAHYFSNISIYQEAQ